MRLRRSPRPIVLTLAACLFPARHVGALVHEQVAFDSSDVCWWSLVPPDPVCPVLKQHNLTELVENLKPRPNQWDGGAECDGPYCLYANPGFAGGRGIAVITTPGALARVKAVGDLLQEYEVSFDDDAEKVPFRSSSSSSSTTGRGGEALVATRALKRGDPIMAHTPVLLVHHAFTRDASQQAKQQRLLDRAVDALPATTAKMLKDRGTSEGSSIYDILATQSFEVKLGGDNDEEEEEHAHLHDGLFPEASRLHHDCRPNTAHYVDPTTLMHITTAAQPIHPGDPLTLTRLDPFATREERQAQARARARRRRPGVSTTSTSTSGEDGGEGGEGEGCTCPQCTLPPQEAADSDVRLGEIKWLAAKLRDPASPEVATPGLVTYHLGLHENERLHCCLAEAYALAAVNFNMLGYDQHAVRYADLAIDSFRMEKGGVGSSSRSGAVGGIEVSSSEMEALRRDAKGHASWRARVGSKKKKAAAAAAGGGGGGGAADVITPATTPVVTTPVEMAVTS